MYLSGYGNCDLVDLYWVVHDMNLDRDTGYTEVVLGHLSLPDKCLPQTDSSVQHSTVSQP